MKYLLLALILTGCHTMTYEEREAVCKESLAKQFYSNSGLKAISVDNCTINLNHVYILECDVHYQIHGANKVIRQDCYPTLD